MFDTEARRIMRNGIFVLYIVYVYLVYLFPFLFQLAHSSLYYVFDALNLDPFSELKEERPKPRSLIEFGVIKSKS